MVKRLLEQRAPGAKGLLEWVEEHSDTRSLRMEASRQFTAASPGYSLVSAAANHRKIALVGGTAGGGFVSETPQVVGPG